MNEPPFPDGVPKLSGDALVCRFNGFGGQPKSVIMDRATRMIHFQNCHVPSKFLAVAAQPWFSSPFNGLVAAHEYHRRKGKREPLGLIIVTHAGKATNLFLSSKLPFHKVDVARILPSPQVGPSQFTDWRSPFDLLNGLQ